MCCVVSSFHATPASMHGGEGGCAFQTTRTVISRTIVIVELQVSEFQGTRHVSTSDRREGLRSLRRMTRIGHPTFQGTSRRVPTALSLSPYIFFAIFTKNNTDVQCRSDKGTAEVLPPHHSGGESLRLICHTLHTQRARSPVPPFPRGNAYIIKNTPFSFSLSPPFFRFFILKKVLTVCRFFSFGICMTFMPLVVPVHNT